MEHHARETYFVVGEGTLINGERAPVAETVGAAGAGVAAEAPSFRFSRIGPRARSIGVAPRRKLATAMTVAQNTSSSVPAGFTYLGQFVDHDLTFDATKVALGENLTVDELVQLRSPRLDLDSLYGRGPTRKGSKRFFRDDGVRLKTGSTVASFGGGNANRALAGFDLPRVGGSGPIEAQRKALIPDLRNDENLAVAQTHLAFIRFHNRVVGRLAQQGVPATDLFRLARRQVVRHYQWMVRTDFLPRVVSPAALDDVFTNGRKIFEVGVPELDPPTMPIEFSIAAYRLGHSMIRDAYNWNRVFDDGGGTLDFLFEFSGTSGTLNGGTALPSNWVADFRRLFDFSEAGRADLTVPSQKFNRTMRIDTRLVDPLALLPPASFGGNGSTPAIERNLAFRNLTRAKMLSLATGQQMFHLVRNAGIDVRPLAADQIIEGLGGASVAGLTADERKSLVERTPLWFYVLREAEFGKGKLRGVGARIVAETFHRAIEASQPSIVRDDGWRPSLGPDSNTFRMVDLLLFAFDGNATKLNPLGDA